MPNKPAALDEYSDDPIEVDLNKWFAASTEIRISQTPICHSPGALAMQFANNYVQMFSIKQQ